MVIFRLQMYTYFFAKNKKTKKKYQLMPPKRLFADSNSPFTNFFIIFDSDG